MIDTALNVLIVIGASAAIFSLLVVLLIVTGEVHVRVRQWRDDRDRLRRIQRMNAEIQDQAAKQSVSMRVCEDLFRLPARDPRVHG